MKRSARHRKARTMVPAAFDPGAVRAAGGAAGTSGSTRAALRRAVSRTAAILVAVATLAAGCATGLARWEAVPARRSGPTGRFAPYLARPLGQASREAFLDDVATSPADWPPLAAAVTVEEREPTGFGISVAFQTTPLVGESNMIAGFDTPYVEAFEPGLAFSFGFIVRRPVAGVVSIGDTYALLSVDYQSFTSVDTSFFLAMDPMTVIGVWFDAKTMLRPRRGGVFKPYVLYGVGFAYVSSVVATFVPLGLDVDIFESSLVPGVRAKLGVEVLRGNLRLFADVGVQVTSAPSVGPDLVAAGYGNGEPMFVMPMRIGVVINF